MTPADFRAARDAFSLTQQEWGLVLGIGREHVAKIETGRVVNVSKTLALLVQAYQRHGLPPA